jgi:hypothetical protein
MNRLWAIGELCHVGFLPARWPMRTRSVTGFSRQCACVHQKPFDFSRCTEAHDSEAAQRFRPISAPSEVGADGPHEERVAPPDDSPQRLSVVIPESLAPARSPPRTPDEPRHPDANWQIEPDDDVGPLDHEITELAPVGPVDDPAVGSDDRFDLRAQYVVWRLDPARPVNERVQLDERDAQPMRKLPPERRLAVPACTCNDRDLSHRVATLPTRSTGGIRRLLAAEPVVVAVEAMWVGSDRPDWSDAQGANIGAIEVGRRRRYAAAGVVRVALA